MKSLLTIMYNFIAKFGKILDVCKYFSKDLVNNQGNVPRRGTKPKFSDIEIIALNITADESGYDSECRLFNELIACQSDIPKVISRRQYNDRRKNLSELCEVIRKRIANTIDGAEDHFCIDSKPIPVCRISRSRRCKMGKDNIDKAPDKGYCASQGMYYYGYKLHAVCGLSGVIHSYDLTRASVHDLKYLNDVQADYHDCVIIGDKGYISQPLQLDLFVTANIDLKAQRRKNQKDYHPPQKLYTKARKRIETIFSQLADQYMIERNYAKQTRGFFTRIKSKIAALTFAQYFNFINHKPIGRVKYAI